MSAQPSLNAAPRSAVATVGWAALVLALSAIAWLAWLSYADDQAELTPWQITGVVLTLLAGVVIGVLRLGVLSAWALTIVPFAGFGAYSIFGSDPLGPIGAGVWIIVVVLGVSVALVMGVQALVRMVRRGGA